MPPIPHSHKELTGKLNAALAAFGAGSYSLVDGPANRHIHEDMRQLGLTIEDEYWDLVYECIQLALQDPIGCFRRPTPPKSTKHPEIKGHFLWAFEVLHPDWTERLYFKFCLKPVRQTFWYFHVDCHPSTRR